MSRSRASVDLLEGLASAKTARVARNVPCISKMTRLPSKQEGKCRNSLYLYDHIFFLLSMSLIWGNTSISQAGTTFISFLLCGPTKIKALRDRYLRVHALTCRGLVQGVWRRDRRSRAPRFIFASMFPVSTYRLQERARSSGITFWYTELQFVLYSVKLNGFDAILSLFYLNMFAVVGWLWGSVGRPT